MIWGGESLGDDLLERVRIGDDGEHAAFSGLPSHLIDRAAEQKRVGARSLRGPPDRLELAYSDGSRLALY
jgi:hypothetical protein